MIRIQDYLPTAKEEAANDEVLRPLREQAREDKRRQEISAENSFLRFWNYHTVAITQADYFFFPLRSLITGEPIADFPRTIRMISLLDEDRADFILEHLGLATTGTVADKRNRICDSCGVLPESSLEEFTAKGGMDAPRVESKRCEVCRLLVRRWKMEEYIKQAGVVEEPKLTIGDGDIELECQCQPPVVS